MSETYIFKQKELIDSKEVITYELTKVIAIHKSKDEMLQRITLLQEKIVIVQQEIDKLQYIISESDK